MEPEQLPDEQVRLPPAQRVLSGRTAERGQLGRRPEHWEEAEQGEAGEQVEEAGARVQEEVQHRPSLGLQAAGPARVHGVRPCGSSGGTQHCC